MGLFDFLRRKKTGEKSGLGYEEKKVPPSTGGDISGAGQLSPATPVGTDWQPGQVWPVGKEVMGLYRIEGVLGEGGMGLVYKAQDLVSRQPVVIKTLKPRYAQDQAFKHLFLREAEEWVKIGVHPNIVRAYDVWEIEHLPRIVAEFVDGDSLDILVARETLPLQTALSLAVQVCWGMAFAHDKGLAHRDLKPDNIFVTQEGVAKVADFGLVKREEESALQADPVAGFSGADLTAAGWGTPPYMAPEQWQGKGGKPADIYAFGVILYELCCGRRPFDFPEAPNDLQSRLYRRAHLEEEPPNPRAFRADLPEFLAALMRQCLEKDPARRPPDFRTIASVIALMGQKNFHLQLPAEPTPVELDKQSSLDQAWAFVRLGEISRFQGYLDKALRLQQEALKAFTNLGDQYGASSCYLNMGNIYFACGDYDQATKLYKKSLKLKVTLRDKDGISHCYGNLGNIYNSRGEYDMAVELYEKSLKLKKFLRDQIGISQCYDNIGIINYSRGNYDQALEMYEHSLEINQALGDQKGISNCYVNMGIVYNSRGNYDQALKMYEHSLGIKRALGDQSGISYCYLNMGITHHSSGEYDRALKMYELSMEISNVLNDQSGISYCYLNMGSLYYSIGDYDQALKMYEKSKEISKILGDQGSISCCYLNMGNIYYSCGDYNEALRMYERCLEIKIQIGDPDLEKVALYIDKLKKEKIS